MRGNESGEAWAFGPVAALSHLPWSAATLRENQKVFEGRHVDAVEGGWQVRADELRRVYVSWKITAA